MKKLYLFAVVSLIALSCSVFAQNIKYVKPVASGTGDGSSWSNASSDLQAIIDAGNTGDSVFVAAGTYYPTKNVAGTTDNRDKAFAISKAVNIFGGFLGNEETVEERNYTANPTILSGDLLGNDILDPTDLAYIPSKTDNTYHVVVVLNRTSAELEPRPILDGFIIERGYASVNSIATIGGLSVNRHQGGAIGTRGGNVGVLWRNLILRDNEAIDGGAVSLHISLDGRIHEFENVTFSKNRATNRAGAFMMTIVSGAPTIILRQCKFIGNTAVGSYGGALVGLASNQNIEMESCLFENNISGAHGGAIYATNKGYFKLSNTVFRGNTAVGASSSGGGLYISTSENSAANNYIKNVVFENNTAGSAAGAIYFNSNSTPVTNAKFYANTAVANGGAIFVFGAASTSKSLPVFTNCIFYDNKGKIGGGMILSNNSDVKIINSTFFNNAAQTGQGGAVMANISSSTLRVYNSIAYGNTAATGNADFGKITAATLEVKNSITQVYAGLPADENLVNDDPEFVSVDKTSVDFLKLGSESKAINMAENSYLPNGVDKDAEGNDRIVYDFLDMGAYEYNGPLLGGGSYLYVNENAPVNTEVGAVTSSLTGNVVWTLISGNIGDAFTLNSVTGMVTVKTAEALDYETRRVFRLRVNANNGTTSITFTAFLFVNNLMEDPGRPTILNVVNGEVRSYRPKLTGKGETLSTVYIYMDDIKDPLYTTQTDKNGDWSFNFEESIPHGLHSFYVVTESTVGKSNPGPRASARFILYPGASLNKIVNNILTPNSDGKNDYWVIENLSLMYPKNDVTVFDKSGKTVFNAQNYLNDWDGKHNNKLLDAGTYYYYINIGAGLKPLTGTLTILRSE